MRKDGIAQNSIRMAGQHRGLHDGHDFAGLGSFEFAGRAECKNESPLVGHLVLVPAGARVCLA